MVLWALAVLLFRSIVTAVEPVVKLLEATIVWLAPVPFARNCRVPLFKLIVLPVPKADSTLVAAVFTPRKIPLLEVTSPVKVLAPESVHVPVPLLVIATLLVLPPLLTTPVIALLLLVPIPSSVSVVVPEVAAVHVVPSVEVRMTPLSPMAMKVLPKVVRALKFVVTGDVKR
jgi:hypothetical protein